MSAGATRALVVDDERMNREVVVANLKSAGFETVTAADGQEAWEALDGDPDGFDVILLDRRMPRMDGMELLARIKADQRLRGIPVIMQTAYASNEDVVAGIEAGVFYYLAKPLNRRILLSVVQQAVEEHVRFRRLQDDLEKRTNAVSLLDSGVFHFRTLEEGNALAVALARSCPRSRLLVLGLSEIFTNAVEHGNLAIAHDEKAHLLADKRWTAEIEARLQAPEYRERWVTVEFERRRGEVRFTVRDQGAGFDWRRYVELDAARAFNAHGRGIAMVRRMSFDDVEYRDPGNEVVCTVRDESLPGPPSAAQAAAATGPSDDTRLARVMQADLMPTAAEIADIERRYGLRVSGLFETSAELGGDIWGIQPLDDFRFALYLADFSGHGVSAALNTFRLHTLVRHAAEGRGQPERYLTHLNGHLAGLLPVGHYATMLYGVMDVANGQFTYAAAGAPHPVAVDLASGEAVVGDGSGLPLGIVASARYRERSLDVGPGRLLFLFSDALTECKLDTGAALGSAGVVDMVRGQVAAGTASDVHDLTRPFLASVRRPLRDDLTAVCCLHPRA